MHTVGPIILGTIALAASIGCAAPAPRQGRIAAPPARFVASTSSESIRDAASNELGPEIAASMPAVDRPAPRPADPGAVAIADSMLTRLEPRLSDSTGITWIGVSQIRNFSRCRSQEYAAFLDRLAGLLSGA